MSKWLTTGEMIDTLKVGEVAECQDHRMKITKGKEGNLEHVDHPQGTVVMYPRITNTKWRIIPNYVSFGKAMTALEYGHTVTFHDKDGSTVSFNVADLLNTTLDKFLPLRTWSAFTNGEWTIENV